MGRAAVALWQHPALGGAGSLSEGTEERPSPPLQSAAQPGRASGPEAPTPTPPILFLRGVINHRAPDRSSNGEESPWVELLACTLEDVHLLMIIFFSLYNHLFSHRHIHTYAKRPYAKSSALLSCLPMSLPNVVSSSVITA